MAEVSEHHDIIERWVDALRSGEYKAHKNDNYATMLCTHDAETGIRYYNAFGVFCDLYNPSGWTPRSPYFYYTTDIMSSGIMRTWCNYIPRQITNLVDLPKAERIVADYEEITKNPFFNEPFAKIADYIEENYL